MAEVTWTQIIQRKDNEIQLLKKELNELKDLVKKAMPSIRRAAEMQKSDEESSDDEMETTEDKNESDDQEGFKVVTQKRKK